MLLVIFIVPEKGLDFYNLVTLCLFLDLYKTEKSIFALVYYNQYFIQNGAEGLGTSYKYFLQTTKLTSI